ncbi:MAG TPA: YdeI/OmpD-associated family protein [Terriglobales bacterium]
MNQPNPKVDTLIKKSKKWQEEFETLRQIVLESPLAEDVKWGQACYALDGKNVVLIHGFKDYCALLFFKGALLKDPRHILIQQTENVQSARQIRFTNARDIVAMKSTLKAYIQEAIDAEKSGAKIKLKKTSDYKVPEEFQKRLDQNAALKRAFAALTPGRQHGYLYYFSSAKQPQTREARVEKYIPQILKGKGLDD